MLNTNPQRFVEKGYCLFPDTLDSQEISTLRRMLDAALAPEGPVVAREAARAVVSSGRAYSGSVAVRAQSGPFQHSGFGHATSV